MMKSSPGDSLIDRNKLLLESAQEHVYKETDDGLELKAYVFSPHESSERLRTAIIFFFASAWDKGVIAQFGPQAMHFIDRDAVAILVEYRTSSLHGANPLDSMSDARSAIRWARYNAEALGIDSHRIIAIGGSGGAQLALSSAMIQDVADDPADPNISCVPDGLVLYSAAVDTSKKGFGHEHFLDANDANRANPSKHISKNLPPMLFLHGAADRIIPISTVARFAKQIARKRNVCDMTGFEGKDHSFYNFNVDPEGYEAAMAEVDRFLSDQGFIAAREPDDDDFAGVAHSRCERSLVTLRFINAARGHFRSRRI